MAVDLVERLEEIRKREAEKEKSEDKPIAVVEEDNPTEYILMQKELWSSAIRFAPNDIIRSALFNVRNHKIKREMCKDQTIATFGNTKISYTGEELRQDDEDVLLQILYVCRDQPLGSPVELKRSTFLNELKWPKQKHYYDRLRDIFLRLTSTALSVRNEEHELEVAVSLIRKFEYKSPNGSSARVWKVWLEPEIRKLFGSGMRTYIEWEKRLQLTPMAKWLYSFYSTHANPYPVKLETLRECSGSSTAALKKFKQTVSTALDKLVDIGFLESWKIEKNLVSVLRVKILNE